MKIFKPQAMTVGRTQYITIKLDNEELEQVDEFVYLGSVITQYGKCTKDADRRISLASAIVNKFSRIWKSHNISSRVKARLYETIEVSVCVYGSECWCLKKEDERRMLSAEMAWLRGLLCKGKRYRSVQFISELRDATCQWYRTVLSATEMTAPPLPQPGRLVLGLSTP